jgi:hypothetical protein
LGLLLPAGLRLGLAPLLLTRLCLGLGLLLLAGLHFGLGLLPTRLCFYLGLPLPARGLVIGRQT